MANKKTDVALLCRGLGMGMAFLQALCEEIIAAGGFEEMIHFITKEHARPICAQIAQMIVKSEWKIPRSLMEKLARETSLADYGGDFYAEHDTHYDWYEAARIVGLPITRFAHPNYLSGVDPVPEILVNQIIGSKPAPYPLRVDWEGESHVVVLISGAGDFKKGEIVAARHEDIVELYIVPARFFNLEQ